ncbi:CDP-glycerol glycerophosphotransferase family protein [Apilactobacillus ozensis]|uniref:CDP-glycerol glycerophosphotransferase family protein n=1 Tax=Apilactobacillus ozensis TaxID=866801 RepID=UPI0034E2AB8E
MELILKKYKQRFVKESHRWDYLIAPNQYSKEIFKRAFDFKGESLDFGYPRNDVLYQYRDADMRKLKK